MKFPDLKSKKKILITLEKQPIISLFLLKLNTYMNLGRLERLVEMPFWKIIPENTRLKGKRALVHSMGFLIQRKRWNKLVSSERKINAFQFKPPRRWTCPQATAQKQRER